MTSHDGIKDSLTNLAAPTLLYEELRRELARARRSSVSFYAIKIILRPASVRTLLPGQTAEADDAGNFRVASVDERETLVFSQALAHGVRAGDICARMGSHEFLILLHDSSFPSHIFIDRLTQRWKRERTLDPRLRHSPFPQLDISVAISSADEGSLALLNRLDFAEVAIWSDRD